MMTKPDDPLTPVERARLDHLQARIALYERELAPLKTEARRILNLFRCRLRYKRVGKSDWAKRRARNAEGQFVVSVPQAKAEGAKP